VHMRHPTGLHRRDGGHLVKKTFVLIYRTKKPTQDLRNSYLSVLVSNLPTKCPRNGQKFEQSMANKMNSLLTVTEVDHQGVHVTLALHPHSGLKSGRILYLPQNLTLKFTLDAHFSTVAIAIASCNCSRRSLIPHLTAADGV
jgi:hypothetical protein